MNVLLLLFLTASSVAGYNILCLHTVPSKSHYHLMMGIANPLLKAGHQVTFVSAFPEEKPMKNLTSIHATSLVKLLKGINVMKPFDFALLKQFARNTSIVALEEPAVRDALINNQYDAVITEWFYSDLSAGYAAIQQVPWIMLCGTVIHSHMEYLVDTVRSTSTVPDLFNFFPVPLNFWQRLFNSFTYIMMSLDFWKTYPSMKYDYETVFGPLAAARGVTLPPFDESHNNISIVFANSHPSFAPVRVLPPNVIDIGGYHMDDNIPALPEDLQKLMDSSTQGVIYFSMGSVLKSSMLEEETKRELVEMFAKLPYTVLWKFEDKFEGLPKNIHVRPWMPQTSILAHPNTKVFITHGGLLSTLEAIKFGVPMVVIPVFGDQPANAKRSVVYGLALQVDFTVDMSPSLKKALNELMANDSYYKKAKSISAIFNKRAVHTSTLITHYIELAIETRGAYHLRSKTKLYAWYEHMMLDQIILLLAILYLLKRAVQRIICSFTNRNSQKIKKN